MENYVYVLGSNGKGGLRTYVGWTNNLENRLAKHNAGTGARSTKGRDWVLLYVEKHLTKQEAMSREWYLKRNSKFRSKLRELLIY